MMPAPNTFAMSTKKYNNLRPSIARSTTGGTPLSADTRTTAISLQIQQHNHRVTPKRSASSKSLTTATRQPPPRRTYPSPTRLFCSNSVGIFIARLINRSAAVSVGSPARIFRCAWRSAGDKQRTMLVVDHTAIPFGSGTSSRALMLPKPRPIRAART